MKTALIILLAFTELASAESILSTANFSCETERVTERYVGLGVGGAPCEIEAILDLSKCHARMFNASLINYKEYRDVVEARYKGSYLVEITLPLTREDIEQGEWIDLDFIPRQRIERYRAVGSMVFGQSPEPNLTDWSIVLPGIHSVRPVDQTPGATYLTGRKEFSNGVTHEIVCGPVRLVK